MFNHAWAVDYMQLLLWLLLCFYLVLDGAWAMYVRTVICPPASSLHNNIFIMIISFLGHKMYWYISADAFEKQRRCLSNMLIMSQ